MKNKELNYKIIKFMRAKANKLKKSGSKVDYFNKKDEGEILKWSKSDCKKTIAYIMFYINSGISRLCGELCPFCVKFFIRFEDLVCSSCHYAHNHNGECCEDQSDYNNILRKHEETLTSKFYDRIKKHLE